MPETPPPAGDPRLDQFAALVNEKRETDLAIVKSITRRNNAHANLLDAITVALWLGLLVALASVLVFTVATVVGWFA